MRRLASARWRHEHRRGIRVVAGAGICAVVIGGLAIAVAAARAPGGGFGREQVGHTYARGILLPTNQWVKPIGTRILDRHGRLLSSSISPNGTFLAALTWNFLPVSTVRIGNGFLTIINLKTGKVIQQVGTGVGSDKNIGDGTVAADGPLWSADGRTLWFPQATDLVRFSVAPDGKVSAPVTIPLEQSVTTTSKTVVPDLPSGMALGPSHRLYVALNGVNELGVINTATDKLARIIRVGNAPRQVVLANHGQDAFVSDEGGRPVRPAARGHTADPGPVSPWCR